MNKIVEELGTFVVVPRARLDSLHPVLNVDWIPFSDFLYVDICGPRRHDGKSLSLFGRCFVSQSGKDREDVQRNFFLSR